MEIHIFYHFIRAELNPLYIPKLVSKAKAAHSISFWLLPAKVLKSTIASTSPHFNFDDEMGFANKSYFKPESWIFNLQY